MTKRFSMILVMLFWCSVALAQSSLPECEGNDKNISKYSKKHFKIMRKWTNCHGTAMGPKGQKYIGEFLKGEFHGQGIFRYEGREYVGQYKKHKRHGQGTYTYADGSKYVGGWRKHEYHGEGTFTSAGGTVDEGIWKNGKLVTRKILNIAENKRIEMATMIDDAKNTCKDLGFEEGTDKFADCSLKLYSQSVELAAKNKQQVVQSGMSSGVVTIYDPVRDRQRMIDQGMKMITGRCTIGVDC